MTKDDHIKLTYLQEITCLCRDDNQFLFTVSIFLELLTIGLNVFFHESKDLKVTTADEFSHTHYDLLFESGANIQEVQNRLGNKDIKTNMNICTHVTEKVVKKNGDVFAKFMEN